MNGMQEQETLEAAIAICRCCLLGREMQDCPVCRFNIGLAVQVDLPGPQERRMPQGERIAGHAMIG